MLALFKSNAEFNSNNVEYQFWIQNNYPIELITPKWIKQKLRYIHLNPVKAGWVDNPEHYLYSSARNYLGLKGLIDVDILEFGNDIGYVYLG